MELRRTDITVRPTQHGFLFLGILIAMLLGSINYNNNAGFILVFLLGGMAIISLFHSYNNLVGLTLTPRHVHPVFKGDTAVFPVELRGDSIQGKTLFFKIGDTAPIAFSKEAGDSAPVALRLPSSQRGYLVPGDIELTSVYPFGLFRLKATIPLPARGIVYPAPVPGTFPLGFAGDMEEGRKESSRLGPDDFQGLKPYIPGNPIGHIAWKTLSRGQGLFIKDFTAETGNDIWMDLSLIKKGSLEERLSMICHRILESERQQQRYGLRLGTAFSRQPARGETHRHRCLKALALYNNPGTHHPGADR
jgi:uncharacterized protein (DUF58 family)